MVVAVPTMNHGKPLLLANFSDVGTGASCLLLALLTLPPSACPSLGIPDGDIFGFGGSSSQIYMEFRF